MSHTDALLLMNDG